MTSTKTRDSIAVLSPLVTEALALLDQPGQNPLYGPIPALLTVATELTDDKRDLAWRIDWIKTTDAQPIGTTGRITANAPTTGGPNGTFDLDAALAASGLTEAEQQHAKEAILIGEDFTDAIDAAKQRTQNDNMAMFRRMEAESWGERAEASARQELSDKGLSDAEVEHVLDEADRTGQSIDEAHLRYLASRMTDRTASTHVTVLFDRFSGDDNRLQEHELRAAVSDESLTDDQRAAAMRILGSFDNVDVAHQSDLTDSLRQGDGFDLTESDGDISTRDLAEYPEKNHQWVTLAPWIALLDIAAKGGSPDGTVSDEDIDAFLDIENVPDDVKLAVVAVFGNGTGDHSFVAPSALPGTIPQLPTVSPVAPPTPTTPSGPGTNAYATAFILGWMVGWEVGGEIDDHRNAANQTHITLVDPDTGRVAHVPIAMIQDLPVEDWPQAIEGIIAGSAMDPDAELPLISTEIESPLQLLADSYGVDVADIEHCLANYRTDSTACHGLPDDLLAVLISRRLIELPSHQTTASLTYESSSKHHQNSGGYISPPPENGQAALDLSTQVKATSTRRVAYEPSAGEFVVLDQTQEGIFHGHIRSWDELHIDMQNALVRDGQVDRRGRPLE